MFSKGVFFLKTQGFSVKVNSLPQSSKFKQPKEKTVLTKLLENFDMVEKGENGVCCIFLYLSDVFYLPKTNFIICASFEFPLQRASSWCSPKFCF